MNKNWVSSVSLICLDAAYVSIHFHISHYKALHYGFQPHSTPANHVNLYLSILLWMWTALWNWPYSNIPFPPHDK